MRDYRKIFFEVRYCIWSTVKFNDPIFSFSFSPFFVKIGEKGHEWKVHKKPKGPGIYVVVKCGASGHNIRSNPNLLAPPIGMLGIRVTLKIKD